MSTIDIQCLFRPLPARVLACLVRVLSYFDLICFGLFYWFAWLVVVGCRLAGLLASSVVGSFALICAWSTKTTHLISTVSVAPHIRYLRGEFHKDSLSKSARHRIIPA